MFETEIKSLDAKINEYVKKDVSANYTFEQYEASLPVLIELGRLRALSIRGQLEGTIPSTSSGQSSDSSSLIDANGITLSDLGTMGGGNRPGVHGNQPTNWTEKPEWPEGQNRPDGFPGNMDKIPDVRGKH